MIKNNKEILQTLFMDYVCTLFLEPYIQKPTIFEPKGVPFNNKKPNKNTMNIILRQIENAEFNGYTEKRERT